VRVMVGSPMSRSTAAELSPALLSRCRSSAFRLSHDFVAGLTEVGMAGSPPASTQAEAFAVLLRNSC
jgi:hypothetical protein